MTTDTITSNVSDVVLSDGYTYSNPVTVASGVEVSHFSHNYGIYAYDQWAIDNQGSIDGIAFQGGGGSLLNAGTILGGQHGVGVIEQSGIAVTVDNFGVISADGYGLYLLAGGSVTNETGGTISGGTGAGVFETGTSATLENAGTITGGTNAVDLEAATNRLIVDAGAVFNGQVVANATADNTLELSASGGAGTINGIGTHYTGFHTVTVDSGATWTIGAIYGGSAVENSGTILNTADGGRAIDLVNGGSVTNAASGVIAGNAYGIKDGTGTGTVLNDGTITGTVANNGYGVSLHGGLVSNSGSGLIAGSRYGVYFNGAAGTVINAGTITASGGNQPIAIEMKSGGSVTNTGTGSITGSVAGISIDGAAGTVDNSGTITSTASHSTAVVLNESGNVTNEIGGHISGPFDGVYLVDAGTVINHGYIGGGAAVELGGGGVVSNDGTLAGGTYGVYLDNGGSVTNAAGGTISASYGSAIDVQGAAGTIDNAGVINTGTDGYAGVNFEHGGSLYNHGTGSIVGYDFGVRISGGAGTVDNSGTIQATGGNTTGVYLAADGSITNEAGGAISGTSAGIYAGKHGHTVTVTVINAGSIDGGAGFGVFAEGNGSLTNLGTGTITGGAVGVFMVGDSGAVDNSGAISGAGAGIVIGATIASVGNSGVISGAYTGVQLTDGGTIGNAAGGTITGVVVYSAPATIDNAGTISSAHGALDDGMGGTTFGATDGVAIFAGGTLLNEHGGQISGGLYGVFAQNYGGTASATVENAGTITGGTHAVYLNAATNRVIVDAGAVFNGDVVANATAANTIELTSGASAGTLNGLGSEYVGFQTVVIDTNAHWTVTGTKTGIGTTAIQGFNTHDTLDITDLTFAAGDTVNIDDVTDVLTILGADGHTVLDTIQLGGDFAGKFFHLTDDGIGGTDIAEDSTPCYLRGTLILTPGGQVRVEDLKIGDPISIFGGEALPLKWIGRRGYRDWLAVGNADAQPILFKTGSLGDGVPARDLYVSSEHAMFLDGMFVPAHLLVNGKSIVKCEGHHDIEYFHLEFDRHVVIVAEGAAAESFVDDESRMLFHNADEYRRLYPDEPRRRFAEFCAPRVESGPKLAALCKALAARARRLRLSGKAIAWEQRGKVDLRTRTLVTGWAYSGAKAGPQALAILANGAVVGQVIADLYRADLEAAGIGDGRHGFSFRLPKGLAPDADHHIEVRREVDWSVV